MSLRSTKKTVDGNINLNKSLNKSNLVLPPLNKSKIGDYIEKSLDIVNKGCYQNGKLKIDNDYGDYRMAIFRRKNRIQHYKFIPSMFTKDLVEKIQKSLQNNQQHHKIVMNIIKQPNNQYLESIKQRELLMLQIQQNSKAKKSIFQQSREEDGCLLYKYFPKEEQSWFQTVDKSQEYQKKKKMYHSQIIKHQNRQANIKKKPRSNYIFKYLQYGKIK